MGEFHGHHSFGKRFQNTWWNALERIQMYQEEERRLFSVEGGVCSEGKFLMCHLLLVSYPDGHNGLEVPSI